ncbi:MAG: mercuric reductase [Gemmatimonadota bacterium]
MNRPDTRDGVTGVAPYAALEPWDEHNRRLAANLHPADWHHPEPRERYDLVVIGGGTAGLVTAAIAVALGARVALIERKLLGGDCLNVGCVPSKAMIAAARAWTEANLAEERFGGPPAAVGGDFAAVMERIRRLRADISEHDSAGRFTDLGVDVFLGEASFAGAAAVRVGDATFRFRKAVIATGTRPAVPDVPGLEDAEYLTNETVFTLTEQPRRLAVIGGGSIGCELAQAFAAFGTRVTLLEAGERILASDDPDAAAVVRDHMVESGVEIHCGVRLVGVTGDEERGRSIRYELDGATHEVHADAILVATGRVANVEGLKAEAAGVQVDSRRGVEVDDHLRTANADVFAIGDVASALKFTHLADAHARLVVRNALFFGRGKASDLVVPWCTYTTPELAHVGIGHAEVGSRGDEIDTITVPFSSVDRARLDGDEEGFLRMHLSRGSDTILGATLVGGGAGDIISQITQAMTAGVGLGRLSETIFPYPTRAEIIRKAADAWRRQKLTPRAQKLFELFFRVRR